MEVEEAEWSWLEPHAKRGAIVLVDVRLSLMEAAHRVAQDDKEAIQKWLRSKEFSKPDETLLESWTKTPTKRFKFVVVQPFVLIQELLLN